MPYLMINGRRVISRLKQGMGVESGEKKRLLLEDELKEILVDSQHESNDKQADSLYRD